jgi:hypothetical protein
MINVLILSYHILVGGSSTNAVPGHEKYCETNHEATRSFTGYIPSSSSWGIYLKTVKVILRKIFESFISLKNCKM